MTTRTDYLAGADQMDANLIEILYGWVVNESSNLEAFINNPSEHVNYNPYVIFDFTKLNERLSMLQAVSSDLNTVIKYKQQDPNFSESMYQTALDQIGSIIFQRLLDWMNFKYVQMTELINNNGDPNNISPLHDYVGMFTFDQNKFMADYNMYANTISGCAIVVNYKIEQGV